jgi:ribosomal protein S17E
MSTNGSIKDMANYITQHLYVAIAHEENKQNNTKLLQKLDELKTYFEKHKDVIAKDQTSFSKELQNKVNQYREDLFYEKHILESMSAYVNYLELHKPDSFGQFVNIDAFKDRIRATEKIPKLRY